MPATQPSKELRAFCHEHHVEMRLTQGLSDNERDLTQTVVYSCPEPDCLVHYNVYRGYFLLSRSGNTDDVDMVPSVRCLQDGAPMYLAEIDPKGRDFRLWICPQCDRRHTNEEGLIGKTSQGSQNVSGNNAA